MTKTDVMLNPFQNPIILCYTTLKQVQGDVKTYRSFTLPPKSKKPQPFNNTFTALSGHPTIQQFRHSIINKTPLTIQ